MRNIKRRLWSIILAVSIVLGIVPGMGLQSNAWQVPEQDHGHLPVYNEYILARITNDYLRSGENNNREKVTPSLGSFYYYKESSSKNSAYQYGIGHIPENYAMFYQTNIWRRTGEDWYTTWELRDDRLPEWFKHLNHGQTSMRLGADFHKYGGSDPYMKLGGQGIQGSSVRNNSVDRKSTTIPLDTHSSITIGGNGKGGKSEVHAPWIVLIDDDNPKIEGAWKAGKATIALQANERLRSAHGGAGFHNMILNIKVGDVRSGKETGEMTAKYSGFGGNTVYFDIQGDLTDKEFQVTRITSVSFDYKDYDFDVYGIMEAYNDRSWYDPTTGEHGYKKEGYENAIKKMTTLEDAVGSPITDVGGNGLKIYPMDLTPFNIVVDSVAPKITGVEVSGDMINPISTIDREDWPEDIDRSSVFAGVGERLYFTIKTDEPVKAGSNDYMYLNIKDGSGKDVAIKCNNDYTMTYGPLIIKRGMTSTDGLPIHPVGNTSGAKDHFGNALDLSKLGEFSPSHGIYLDSISPWRDVELISESENRNLSLKLDFYDRNGGNIESGFVGRFAEIGLAGKSSPPSTFKYAFTYSPKSPFMEDYDGPEIDSEYTGRGQLGIESKPMWTTVPLHDYKTIYLHAEIEGENSLTISDISARIRLTDWAGNWMNTRVSIDGYSLDETPPRILLNYMKPSYDSVTATVYSEFEIRDINSDGLLYWYKWDDDDELEGRLTDSTNIMSKIGRTNKFYNNNENFESRLNIRARDAQKNESSAKYSVQVDLTKPEILYQAKNNLNVPDPKPDITVTGSVYSDRTSYTRVTMTPDNDTDKYIRVVKSGESTSLFDFDGKWIKSDSSNNLLGEKNPPDIKEYYGPVTIGFEAAYDTDLTPREGWQANEDDVQNGSYIRSKDIIKLKYAPLIDNLHEISELSYSDAKGESLVIEDYGGGSILFNESMMGSSISFDISNRELPEWGMTNVDFDKSYIALVQEEDELGKKIGREVLTSPLSNSKSQSFTIPSLDEEGNPFTSGLYKVKIYVVQEGGDISGASKAESIWMILDNIQPKNQGIWKYTHGLNLINLFDRKPPESLESITKTAEGLAFSSVGISLKSREETQRNDLYSIESTGVMHTDLVIGIDLKEIKMLGRLVGEVAGMRVWNAKTTGYEDLEFKTLFSDTINGEGKLRQTHRIDKSDIDEDLEGKQADGEIRLTSGSNTIHYQVQMKNGILSPIYSLEINISDQTPVMGLSVDGEASKLDKGLVPKTINKAKLKLNNAFSNNGEIETYFLSRQTSIKINEEMKNFESEIEFASYNVYPYSMNNSEDDENQGNDPDLVTMWGPHASDRQNFTEGTEGLDIRLNKRHANNIFMALDEWGGITLLIPQFRNESYVNEDGREVSTRYKFEDKALTPTYLERLPQLSSLIYQYDRPMEKFYVIIPESTITFTGDDLPEGGITLPVENPPIPNPAGYMGGNIGYTPDGNRFRFEITPPVADESNQAGSYVNRGFTLNTVGIAGDKWYSSVSDTEMKYLDLAETTKVYKARYNRGVELLFSTYVSINGGEYSNKTILPIFTNGSYSVDLKDSYGIEHKCDFIVDFPEFAAGPKLSFSTIEPTTKPVTVTFLSEVTGDISVSGEEDKAVITGNGTALVEALVSENTDLTVSWGDGKSRIISVGNIGSLNPRVVWSYQDEDVIDGELVGSATAVIVDDNWSIVDSVTRELAEYTFYPGGETSHSFSVVNQEAGAKPVDITATLPVTLIEAPAPPDAELDNTKPSMQILAYSAGSEREIPTDQKKSLWLHDFESQWKNFDLMDYQGYTKYTDSKVFLNNLGWGHRHRLRVETSDQSRVKLIIKKGLYAKEPKYTDSSDQVPGVTLSGNALDILRNTAFTLFAVDAADNATAVNMDVNNVGAAPIPKLIKTFPGNISRVYLLPGEEDKDFVDLKITNGDAKQETQGNYTGKWYRDFKENGLFTLGYSYKYKEKTTSGSLDINITEIDSEDLLQVGPTIWSGSKNLEATNHDVVAQLEFNKIITKVTANITSGIEVIVNGNKLAVLYKENLGPITLTCTSGNGKSVKVRLDSVDNIDKIDPIVEIKETSLSDNGRYLTVTFTSNEKVNFQEARKEGSTFEYRIDKNGEYTYHFIDKAGNMTSKKLLIDSLVLDPLRLEYSTSSGGSDPVKYPSELEELSSGDTIYVSANRECEITFNNAEKKSYKGGWLGFIITEDEAGLYPSIHAVDEYGNSALGQLSQINPLDKKAPLISLKRSTLNVEFGKDKDAIKEILKENAIVFDAVDKNPTINIAFTMPDSAMVVPVIYTARDEAGNESQIKGFMRLTDGSEAQVLVDGELIEQGAIVLAKSGPLKLSVNLRTAEPYSVMYKAGIKTAGQMKIGVTDIVRNQTNADEIVLPLDNTGYITVSIVTQGREYFRFLVYIK